MSEHTVRLHVSTGSARHDHALAERLAADLRALGVDAEREADLVRFTAHMSAVAEVVPEGADRVVPGRVRLTLGAEGGNDAAADSRAVVEELERRGLTARHEEVYSAEEEAAVARRLEELGYLG
ncbi:hypothetical protein KGD83_16400 [Nocardiopsis akebiae]|uniref:Uncharacterized protein n=1 Tax=Nocardiopsis akebiae TaxID=2831968 RepID=A0ABX8BXS8_9ACTN|nr:hypothetical protein [Nocardiopsis akebiae]QUX26941.1 hypothetical protein KGD83_16400 [Nocardiopsis akebiae]